MNTFLRPAAIVLGLVSGIYVILLIAAAVAPTPTPVGSERQMASSAVADRLKAEAALLAQHAPRSGRSDDGLVSGAL